MKWEINDSLPIHAQLVDEMIRRILNGVYSPGERIPSVRDLAFEARVNPNTMQKALTELENQKIVYTQRTSGKYVTQDLKLLQELKKSQSSELVRIFLAEMHALGFETAEIIEMLK